MTKDKPKAISMKPCTKSRTYAITIASRPKRHLKLDLYQSVPEWHEETPLELSIRGVQEKEVFKEGATEQL